MKTRILKGLVLGTTLLCANAFAAFDGDYDPSNWTEILGTGSIDVSGAPGSVSLTGGDDGSNTDSNTIFEIEIGGTGTLSFDWVYTSEEANSFWDPFYYVVNGASTQLTTNGVGDQGGSVSITVNAGDIFGLRQRTRDNLFGSATTIVSNFSAPTAVPLPPTFGLLGFALGGMLVVQRRDSSFIQKP